MPALRSVPSHAASLDDSVSRFAEKIFESLPRADQRRWAEIYLRGLLCVEGKKSIRRMAESLVPFPAIQSLQQFVNQSPWDWAPVNKSLHDYVDQEISAPAWSIGTVSIPKRGRYSVGVGRRFVASENRAVNAQIGVGLFLTSARASIPIAWRIVLADRWASDTGLRDRALVPPGYRVASESDAVLDLLDTVQGSWDAPGRPLLADLRGLPGVPALMTRLADRSCGFLVQVDGTVEVREGERAGVRGHLRHSRDTARVDTIAQSMGLLRPARALEIVRPLGRPAKTSLIKLTDPHNTIHTFRLIVGPAEYPGGEARFWITNILDQEKWPELLSFRRLLSRHQHDTADFRDKYGVLDFEGRSFTGWHHHMALASAALSCGRLICDQGVPERIPALAVARAHLSQASR